VGAALKLPFARLYDPWAMSITLADNLFIGTSGFAYKEWKGLFYPNELPQKQYLSYYARHFRTTEINNTFYRMPTASLTQSWYAEAPTGFSFTLKVSQRITHFKRLKNIDSEMEFFLSSASHLKEKLGPLLVQLPPNFKQDLAVLEEFLKKFSGQARLAFEFRHDSWFGDDLFELLRRYDSAFGIVEKEEGEAGVTPREVTAPFVYMRLRKGDYEPGELRDWALWILSQKIPVYCYLKHDDRAPVLATQLIEAIDRA
jgi:uncharacterized protein YecE (DUF72 family)